MQSCLYFAYILGLLSQFVGESREESVRHHPGDVLSSFGAHDRVATDLPHFCDLTLSERAA